MKELIKTMLLRGVLGEVESAINPPGDKSYLKFRTMAGI